MSTALSTHHRFTDPIAAAAAVTVIVGGAALIGVAMAQPDDVAAPSAPSAPAQVAPNPPSRVGQGDFARPRAAASHSTRSRAATRRSGSPDVVPQGSHHQTDDRDVCIGGAHVPVVRAVRPRRRPRSRNLPDVVGAVLAGGSCLSRSITTTTRGPIMSTHHRTPAPLPTLRRPGGRLRGRRRGWPHRHRRGRLPERRRRGSDPVERLDDDAQPAVPRQPLHASAPERWRPQLQVRRAVPQGRNDHARYALTDQHVSGHDHDRDV